MIDPVVTDARAQVQAGVDAVAFEPRLAPRVGAAAAQRHLPVLPVDSRSVKSIAQLHPSPSLNVAESDRVTGS
jgi:hypothetical protein